MGEKSQHNIVPKEVITSRILIIRDQKVIIDRDLAELYHVETKRLNEQVKRNQNRFPLNFMFQLTKEEKDEVVAKCDHLENLKFSSYLPFAFTEHGILMVANVLNSDRAIGVSIQIIEAFVKMREIFTDNLNLKLEIEQIKKKLSNHDKNIELVFNYLDELIDKNEEPRNRIGYKK
ncbi:ORF6N domain-containing protein [Aureibaculum algae]|uniref:ORF6N domain-containing protein n=1 Tax=Aureibaculum algae TaxID=2584122 RepID=A0A5B7TWP8_9FLAO|nr:ORF6N domain-containing protein [Aureibaculum algae]QCX40668.1 ORF6N domain-containing protein [Aureibaculum algae]